MSLDEGNSEYAYVEYFPSNSSDNNQYYIQVPVHHVSTPGTPYLHGNNSISTLENTPESVRSTTFGTSPSTDSNTTPVRKIVPSSTVPRGSSTFVDEFLSPASTAAGTSTVRSAVPTAGFLGGDQLALTSSPYVLTPDKDVSDFQVC